MIFLEAKLCVIVHFRVATYRYNIFLPMQISLFSCEQTTAVLSYITSQLAQMNECSSLIVED